MATITFDTLRFSKRLEAAGFTPQQAEAVAEAFKEATSEELVTKSYLDARLAELKAEIRAGQIDLVKWIAGLMLAQAALIAALVKLL